MIKIHFPKVDFFYALTLKIIMSLPATQNIVINLFHTILSIKKCSLLHDKRLLIISQYENLEKISDANRDRATGFFYR